MTDKQNANIPLIIIPAAGFGTRVGSPPAKELLPRPGTDAPLIEEPLRLAALRNWPALVITRPEKATLISYLKLHTTPFLEVAPTRDWPETILLSEEHWRQWNIIVLPDMEFSPHSVLDHLAKMGEQEVDVAWCEHKVESVSTWGVLETVSSTEMRLCEKPITGGAGQAWGLFAFRRESGRALLGAQLASSIDHQWKSLNLRSRHLTLEYFADVTR